LSCKKIAFVLQKIAISTFSHTLGIFISFWNTFSYFGMLSQLLAHCADLSKSEGQLCCCHETSPKPFLLKYKEVRKKGKTLRKSANPFLICSVVLVLLKKCVQKVVQLVSRSWISVDF